MRPLLPTAPLSRAALLGLTHALLLILAFPPVFLPLVALLIPLPALLATRIEDKPKRAALVFGLATAPAWVFFHRWLIDVTLAGYPFLVLILCLYATLFVLVARRAARVMPWWIAAPLAWTAVEFFRGQIAFDGYPWYLTAQPLAAHKGIGLFQYVGVYGAGLFIAAATACAITGPLRRLPYFVVAGLAAWFFAPMVASDAPEYSIAIVQTNVPQDNKTSWSVEQRRADFDRFVELTRLAADSEPDLIAWPETMFPGLALDAESLSALRAADLAYADGMPVTVFADKLLALQREINIPMLVGAIAYDDLRIERTPEGVAFTPSAEYNSAILIVDGQPHPDRYDKLQLTPFGEVMPYISWSDWLESQLLSIGAPGMAFNLDEGAKETVFEVGGVRFATPICFEATMPNVCRRLAYKDGRRRVDMLVQLTNDGWFGAYTGGRETHALLARCRAIELGVSVVRAANSGISVAYGAEGDMIQSLPSSTDGVMTVLFRRPNGLLGGGTIYGRYLGDALGWLALLGTFAGLVVSFRKKKTPPTSDPAPDPESDPVPETAA